MASYVDCASIMFKGKKRHHLTADSVAELHLFAGALGIKRCWFHKAKTHPHYDVTDESREAALAAGAIGVSQKELASLARKLAKPPSCIASQKNTPSKARATPK